jgi:hypothetical protein
MAALYDHARPSERSSRLAPFETFIAAKWYGRKRERDGPALNLSSFKRGRFPERPVGRQIGDILR